MDDLNLLIESGFGSIVLRDIFKDEKIQIDTVIIPRVKGEFRGFQFVPAGIHYINVAGSNGRRTGCWVYLDHREVLVKVLDVANNKLIDDAPENQTRFTELASSGAMGRNLMPYNMKGFEVWKKLTNYITEASLPLELHPIPKKVPNRFAHEFVQVHKKDADSFLAEFQFAFVSWFALMEESSSSSFISNLLSPKKPSAQERWTHLLQSVYNAGERMMGENPDLFCKLVNAMVSQFSMISGDSFVDGSPLCFGVNYLIEDLMDTEIKELMAKSRELESYMASRRQG